MKTNGNGKKRKAKELIARVAKNIKHYRTAKKLTQEQLEEKTKLPISRYESGRNDMTLTTIHILSTHLNVEPYKLLK